MPANHPRPYRHNIINTALLIAMAIASATDWLHRGLAQSPLKHLDTQAEKHIEQTISDSVGLQDPSQTRLNQSATAPTTSDAKP